MAVGFKCGHIKFGALCKCDKCSTAPITSKEKALSMVLTEFCLQGNDMDKYSKLIQDGTIITLDKKIEDKWIKHFKDTEETFP